MIKFHPTPRQLSEFVEGGLSPAISLMVAAHCDMCSRCRSQVELETEALAAQLMSDVDAFGDAGAAFGDMLSSITSESDDAQISQDDVLYDGDFDDTDVVVSTRPYRESIPARVKTQNTSQTSTIELDGRTFKLPRTLQRYVTKTGNWSSLVGKLWQAPVDLGNQGVANFIFMGQGGSVPEHTHRGTEYTLVIDGEFSDGLNSYDTGDFIYMDGDKTHTPRADAKEGCLVFSIVDQPLHFTSGLARLLNPFSHLFFR